MMLFLGGQSAGLSSQTLYSFHSQSLEVVSNPVTNKTNSTNQKVDAISLVEMTGFSYPAIERSIEDSRAALLQLPKVANGLERRQLSTAAPTNASFIRY